MNKTNFNCISKNYTERNLMDESVVKFVDNISRKRFVPVLSNNNYSKYKNLDTMSKHISGYDFRSLDKSNDIEFMYYNTPMYFIDGTQVKQKLIARSLFTNSIDITGLFSAWLNYGPSIYAIKMFTMLSGYKKPIIAKVRTINKL